MRALTMVSPTPTPPPPTRYTFNSVNLAPPRPRSIIHPTHDLLGRYGILPVYDEFVRPFTTSAPGTVEDKGKRREDGQDGPDDARHGPKEGLFQHGYKHFIKDLGRESCHLSLFPITYVRTSWETQPQKGHFSYRPHAQPRETGCSNCETRPNDPRACISAQGRRCAGRKSHQFTIH